MNPTAFLNFFNSKINTSPAKFSSLDELGLSEQTVAYIQRLPDNAEFSVFHPEAEATSDEVFRCGPGLVPTDVVNSGVIRVDVPVVGSVVVAKCAVRWALDGPMFRYDVYFDTPSSDGCLRVPVSGRTLGIAVNHAAEVWDRLFLGGFVMKSERPKSHVC